jgi:hypothetical protein
MKRLFTVSIFCLSLIFAPITLKAQISTTRSNLWTWQVTSNFVVAYVAQYLGSNIFVSPTFPAFYLTTNSWAGPTNSYDMSLRAQWIDSHVPCSLTNLINTSSNRLISSTLYIHNTDSTNWIFRLDLPVDVDSSGIKQITVTNQGWAALTLITYGVQLTNSSFIHLW